MHLLQQSLLFLNRKKTPVCIFSEKKKIKRKLSKLNSQVCNVFLLRSINRRKYSVNKANFKICIITGHKTHAFEFRLA
jgi:hypothetical protein